MADIPLPDLDLSFQSVQQDIPFGRLRKTLLDFNPEDLAASKTLSQNQRDDPAACP